MKQLHTTITRVARLSLITAVTLIVFHTAAAQTPVRKFDTDAKVIAQVTKNLAAGLRSDNPGLVASCMRMSAQLKMRYPSADVTLLTTVINDILTTNTSGTTRYKAYVTLAICEDPATFAADTTVARGSEIDFFRAASHRMQEQLLSSAE